MVLNCNIQDNESVKNKTYWTSHYLAIDLLFLLNAISNIHLFKIKQKNGIMTTSPQVYELNIFIYLFIYLFIAAIVLCLAVMSVIIT